MKLTTLESALGQKPTCAPQKDMSALPPKADIGAAQINVRYGPTAAIPSFPDYFIGTLLQWVFTGVD
jgi:hypothetical protein